MAKKKDTKPKKARKLAKENEGNQPQNDEHENEKPFQFGGLPDRDLKKGLGCGG
jgi:hypothetical protein